MFERIACVNLDRRQDRWQQFVERLPADWPFGEVERYQAIDAKLVPHPPWFRAGGGAYGCYRSHARIIEESLNNGVRSLLLLEDDALFCEAFSDRLRAFRAALPADAGMVYLGGQHLKVNQSPPVRINSEVYRPYNVNRTHAFGFLNRESMREVYRHLTRVDWHRAHHIDHHLGRYHQQKYKEAKAGKIKGPTAVYTPREWMVAQAEGRSNIAGKKTPERLWAPAELLTSRVNRPFVLVLGLHGSGSSALAMTLDALGVHMGNHLQGFHGGEAQRLAEICEKIARFPSTEFKWKDERIEKTLRQWINAKRREASERQTIAGGKYPLLCRLANHVRNIVGKDLRVIHIDRPLDESIESLKRRSRKSTGWLAISDDQAEAVQRWLHAGKTEFLKSQPHLTVKYADLLANPVAECDRIVEYLGLTPTAEQYQAALAIVDPSKRHVG